VIGAYRVRCALAGDLLAVMGVLSERRSTPERPLAPVMVEDRHRAMWARMMSTADLTVYLAECDGEPIGTLHYARSASCYKVQLLSHKRHASDGAHALDASLGFRAEAEGFRLYLDGAMGDDP